MTDEFCLLSHDHDDPAPNWTPAPYTVGWSEAYCNEQVKKYNEVCAGSIDRCVGSRKVTEWTRRDAATVQQPDLPMEAKGGEA